MNKKSHEGHVILNIKTLSLYNDKNYKMEVFKLIEPLSNDCLKGRDEIETKFYNILLEVNDITANLLEDDIDLNQKIRTIEDILKELV